MKKLLYILVAVMALAFGPLALADSVNPLLPPSAFFLPLAPAVIVPVGAQLHGRCTSAVPVGNYIGQANAGVVAVAKIGNYDTGDPNVTKSH